MFVQTVRNKSTLGENTEVCSNSKETAVGKKMK